MEEGLEDLIAEAGKEAGAAGELEFPVVPLVVDDEEERPLE